MPVKDDGFDNALTIFVIKLYIFGNDTIFRDWVTNINICYSE